MYAPIAEVAGQYRPTQSFTLPGPLATVNVIVPPAATDVAEAVIDGGVTVSVRLVGDTPPPGVGLNTVITGFEPAVATSPAAICVVRCIVSRNTVGRLTPPTRTA